MRPHPDLAERLDELALHYGRSWLESDPVRWPRAYEGRADLEVVAVVAALLAYGRVTTIHRSIADVLHRLGPNPSEALSPSRRAAIYDRLDGFRHRFTSGSDLAWLLLGVARARDREGSLGAFVARHAVGLEPLRSGLAAWHALAQDVGADTSPLRRKARAFLLPDPFSGSASKRALLLARWCVRSEDGIDLGIWTSPGRLEAKHLLLPLDTHVHRAALDLGLTRRKTPDWACSREATDTLARFDPIDPVRFDFALSRPGIVGRCLHRAVPAMCLPCELLVCCRKGRRVETTPPRATTSASPA